jgi:hypothetical protein
LSNQGKTAYGDAAVERVPLISLALPGGNGYYIVHVTKLRAKERYDEEVNDIDTLCFRRDLGLGLHAGRYGGARNLHVLRDVPGCGSAVP